VIVGKRDRDLERSWSRGTLIDAYLRLDPKGGYVKSVVVVVIGVAFVAFNPAAGFILVACGLALFAFTRWAYRRSP